MFTNFFPFFYPAFIKTFQHWKLLLYDRCEQISESKIIYNWDLFIFAHIGVTTSYYVVAIYDHLFTKKYGARWLIYITVLENYLRQNNFDILTNCSRIYIKEIHIKGFFFFFKCIQFLDYQSFMQKSECDQLF